jgi:H+/gluconate symporter-like permease
MNYRRLPTLRETMDAGANSSVLPVLTVGSVEGFGAVLAAMPVFEVVRDAVLSIRGGPLVSLTLALMHRVTTISAGTLDALPHNGTVLTVLQVSGLTHRESYFDMVKTVIVSVIISLVAIVLLGSVFGSF